MRTQSFFRINSAALILISSLLLTQCKGPQGEPGPKGDKGDTGAVGPQGAVGSANVRVYTFAKATVLRPGGAEYTLPDHSASSPIRQHFVMVYVEEPGSLTQWWHAIPSPLPDNYTKNVPGFYTFFTDAGVDYSSVYIQRLDANGRKLAPVPDFRTKIVLIPANTIRNGRMASIDYTNYEEVKRVFNLPD